MAGPGIPAGGAAPAGGVADANKLELAKRLASKINIAKVSASFEENDYNY